MLTYVCTTCFKNQKPTSYYPYAPPTFQPSKAHWLLSVCNTWFNSRMLRILPTASIYVFCM